jgi:Zn-dependent peptidase ImmA (M78 family)
LRKDGYNETTDYTDYTDKKNRSNPSNQWLDMTINKNEQLKQLEDTLHRNSVRVIYDILKSEGGMCKVKDKYYVIVNRNISVEQKISVLAHSIMDITGNSVNIEE